MKSGIPAVCDRRWWIVIASPPTTPGTYFSSGSSRRRRPCSTSWSTRRAVNDFETEARRNFVRGVFGEPELHVREAVGLRVDDGAVAHDEDRGAGELASGRGGEDRVDPRGTARTGHPPADPGRAAPARHARARRARLRVCTVGLHFRAASRLGPRPRAPA